MQKTHKLVRTIFQRFLSFNNQSSKPALRGEPSLFRFFPCRTQKRQVRFPSSALRAPSIFPLFRLPPLAHPSGRNIILVKKVFITFWTKFQLNSKTTR